MIEESPAADRWPLAFRIAVAVALGAAVAWIAADAAFIDDDGAIVDDRRPWWAIDPWITGACAMVSAAIAAIAVRRRVLRDALAMIAAAIAGAMLAGGSPGAGGMALVEGPVDLEGTVATEPRIDETGSDALSEHSFREASQSFRFAFADSDDPVTVRVSGMAPLPGRGTPVRVRGWWKPVDPRCNPGTPPRGPSAVVLVTSSRLVTPLGQNCIASALRGLRDGANDALAAAMPANATDGERALVSAMTTGVRLPGLARHAAEFRAAGMSHVLAISGFNVAVLVAGAAAVARAVGATAATRAGVAIATAVAFLIVTEPETSVLRAGLGAGLAAAASIRGGRARGLGTLGMVSLAAMVIDIRCITGAGFQLSYGVVIALLVVAPAVTARWQRGAMAAIAAMRRGSRVPEVLEMAVSAAIASSCAALVAWSTSTPIALHHSGSIAWLAAPLSIVTMPPAAMATIGGVVAMGTMAISGAVGSFAGGMSVLCVRALGWTASTAAAVPWSTSATGRAEPWVAAAMLVCVAVAWMHPRLRWRLCAAAITVAIASGLVNGHLAACRTPIGDGVVVVDSIAVGRGSCTAIRSDDAVVVLDAGSFGNPDAGSRTIVPALASLGIRRVDALLIGSRTLASCSAVPEVLRSFSVGSVIVERTALESFRNARGGHGADMVRMFADSRLTPEELDDGEHRTVGSLRFEALVRPVGDRGQRTTAILVRHRSWSNDRPGVLITPDARVDHGCEAIEVPGANDRAIRLVAGARARDETFAWNGREWKSTGPAGIHRGTTTARSSTANAPASDPSAFDSSISNGSAGRSTRTSRRSRSGPRRSRRSSFPPARTTRSGDPAFRAVAGRCTTMTSRDAAAGAGYRSTAGPSTSTGGASSAQVPANAAGAGVDSRTPSMPFGAATLGCMAASGATDRGEDCTAATSLRGTVIAGSFAPAIPGSRR